jgi:hypothetical protein
MYEELILSTDKTRYKENLELRENATRGGDAGRGALVFVNKGMKFTSEEEGEQAYLENTDS